MHKTKSNTMLQIQDTLVSMDVISKKFICNLDFCKGNCCVYGDYGAPLEEKEIKILKKNFYKIKPYLTDKGEETIKKQGLTIKDDEGDFVTPLIDGKECAFTYFDDNNIAGCAIEKAFLNNDIDFRKPVSCHLYPVRIKKYKTFTAVNYHEWDICNSAIANGDKQGIPVYIFLKDALTRYFGAEWYDELIQAAKTLNEQNKDNSHIIKQ